MMRIWPILLLLPLTNSASAQTGAGIRPYAEVIPQSAITDRGLWTTHQVGDKLYFDLPRSVFDRDLVVFEEPRPRLYNRSRHQLIRWQRRGDQVLLRSVNTTRLGQPQPLGHESIFALPFSAPVDAIVAAFPIAAVGADGGALIEVSRLFVGGANTHWNLADSDFAGQAEVIREAQVRAFPENVIVRLAPRVAWNFVRLPERPMTPRLYDRRIGFWGASFGDRTPPRQLPIIRWRLEKKDSALLLSEPVKPIVIYVDPATPAKWRPLIRQAIEAWQPAFEAAGFKRAIVAQDAPDDPDWSYDDVRHTVLCWQGCDGRRWFIHDPRTGERLQFQINTGRGDRLFLARYIVSLAAVDPRVLQTPFLGAVAGDLFSAIAAHETGHLLGLRDGHYGKFAYTVEQVRSPEWVERMSFTPSVVNYTRFNYVAQPDDEMPPELLVQRVGPADVYSIRWAYTPISGAQSLKEERSTLEKWIADQEATPRYRFLGEDCGCRIDPDVTYEAVEVTDPVEAARLGLRNLERSWRLLRDVTLKSDDPAVDSLIGFEQLYDAAWEQWRYMITPVATLIGGRTLQPGEHPLLDRWTPVPAEAQRQAMAFLAESALHAPPFLIAGEVLSRRGLTFEEAAENPGQQGFWRDLMSRDRFQRLAAAEGARSEEEAPYTLTEALADLRAALWRDLEQPDMQIDPFRRTLQRKYVAQLESWTSASSAMGEFERSLFSAELEVLERLVRAAVDRAGDADTKAHLRQLFAAAVTVGGND